MVGLTANPDKCQWEGRQMSYLGHVVGSGRLAIAQDRALAMRMFERQKSKKGLRSFLGSVGYYQAFIPHFADYSSQLTRATSKGALATVQWTQDMGWGLLLTFVSLRAQRVS